MWCEQQTGHSQSGHTNGMGHEPEQYLKDAQTSFRLASTARTIEETERFAAIGRDYLRLAHEHSSVTATPVRIAAVWPHS
jgi:hypothetical protein